MVQREDDCASTDVVYITERATGPIPLPSESLVCLVGAAADIGRVFPIGRAPLVIGRGETCGVCLRGTDISRAHARVERRDGQLVIEDLGSRNGTTVNGESIRTRVLQSGDRIHLGASAILVVSRYDELEARAQRLQKLDAMAQLAGGVAHDVNNLLTVVLAASELLKLRLLDGCDPDDVREYLAEIETAAREGAGLMSRLLDFARRDSPSEPAVVRLERTVDEVVSMARPSLPESIEVDVKVEPGLQVLAGRRELHQVLLNLIMNARDAMRDGGGLTIRARGHRFDRASALGLQLPGEGRYAELVVEDQGAGMDELTMARAFEPFFTTKQTGQGTGLGLASVYGIARSHGGNALLESTPGRGTIVRVFLPLTNRVAPLETPGRGEAPSGTALVVDDVTGSRRTMTRLLRNLGYAVDEAASGQAALRAFRDAPDRFSLVVVDINMPDVNGVEVVQGVRSIAPDVPILMFSGTAGEQVARQAGADGFVRKPFDLVQLRSTLSRLNRRGNHHTQRRVIPERPRGGPRRPTPHVVDGDSPPDGH